MELSIGRGFGQKKLASGEEGKTAPPPSFDVIQCHITFRGSSFHDSPASSSGPQQQCLRAAAIALQNTSDASASNQRDVTH